MLFPPFKVSAFNMDGLMVGYAAENWKYQTKNVAWGIIGAVMLRKMLSIPDVIWYNERKGFVKGLG